MKKMLVVLAAILLCNFPVCFAGAQQVIWSYQQEIRTVADPLTEKMMLMLNEENYGGFSAAFDSKMKAGLPEEAFRKLCADVKEHYGDYAAKDLIDIEFQGEYIVINYKGHFFKASEPMLIRTVLVQENKETKVGGFWINKLK